ncbi:MAG TPA: arginase family protein [Candidatus Limnocylindrales bacterium]|nr:arginase family protein [Candidatus Limnocylindrales bacterium]
MAAQDAAEAFNTEGLRPWAGLSAPPPNRRPDIRVMGVPLDRGSFYRPGAAQAPRTLRHLSAVFAPVTERAERFSDLTVEDAGDLPIVDGDMGANVDALADAIAATAPGAVPIVLGGDHTTVAPTLVAQQRRWNGRLAILYIDAHPDLNDTSRHSRWSNGCALRRGLELGEIDPRKVMLVGQRDYDWEEVEFIRHMGVTLVPSADLHRMEPARFRERLEQVAGGDAVHISLDIDALDPACAPGTGIPAAGGLTTRQLLDLLYALRGMRLAGMDVDEVAPPLDLGHVTSLAALKCIFEFMGAIHLSRP